MISLRGGKKVAKMRRGLVHNLAGLNEVQQLGECTRHIGVFGHSDIRCVVPRAAPGDGSAAAGLDN